ncbi:MAG: hypothetical protein IIV23_09815 [Ruminococcus sp.]|nr:hypothetical protein [Ruminococcus sp.]
MSLIIKGLRLPKHADVNGEKDTAYKCLILAHSDNSVELVIDTAFASPYDNGHNIQRYPLSEIPTPHGRLIDADELETHVDNWWDIGEYVFADTIRNADTIIEAEVSEE